MSNGKQVPQEKTNPFEAPTSLNPSEEDTAVSPKLDAAELLHQLAETMLNVFDATSVYIGDWQPETGSSTVIAECFSPEATAKEKVSDLGIPYNFNELNFSIKWNDENGPYYYHFDDPNTPQWDRDHMQQHDCKTTLVVPLTGYDHVFGFAEIWESRHKRDYSQKELNLAQQLAQQATITLLNAQLYQAEARRRRESEIVQEIAGYLTSTLNLDEVLTRVIDILRVYLANVQSCAITVLEQDGRFLKKHKGWSEKTEYAMFAEGSGIWLEDAFASRQAIEQKEPVVINDLQQYPFANEHTKLVIAKGLRSILYVPLLIREEPIGLLHISVWENPRQFSQEEIALTKAVANQTAIAIENAKLFAKERQQLTLSRTMQKVGALLTSGIGINDVYERILDLLSEIVDYTSVSIQLLDEQENQFTLGASRGFENTEIVEQILNTHSQEFLNKIPIPPGWSVIEDTAQNEAWVVEPEGPYVRSWIGAGLFIKDRMIGILNVDSAKPYAYNDEIGAIVSIFANQAAIAIENVRLYAKTRIQAEELAILHLLAQTTAVTLEIDKLLQQTTELIAQKQYPYIFGFIMLDEETNILHPHASYHGIQPQWHNYAIPLEKTSISGLVALTGKPYISGNVKEDPLYLEIDPETQSEIAVPIFINNKVIGVINVESPGKNAFSQKDFNFLLTLSVNVATAIERANLYSTLQNQAQALSEQVALQTAKLETESKRTSAILESAGEGILLTDTNTNILYVNRTMEQQTGYSRQELIGQTPRILDSGVNSDKIYETMWRTITKNHRWSGELRNKRKDGTFYDIALTISPLVDETGEISGYVSVHSDISRLKEVDRLKAEFVSNVSHELRTPLTNIKMYISLLERGKQENFPRYFKVLHQESERLSRLIQGLLDISRLDRSFSPDPTIRLEIHPYLQQSIQQWSEESGKKQINIQAKWDTTSIEPLLICMEEHHFNSIMNNLIENAIHFSEPNSKITISTGKVDNYQRSLVWIRIQDEGFGISPSEQIQIYERFFRGQVAYEENTPGAGLGLSIVQETVEGYNGRIELTSQEGEGSTFTVWLPTAQPLDPNP